MIHLPQVVKSFQVDKKTPLPQMPDLQKMIKKMESRLGSEGRILFRYSGTEKKARLMIEGTDRDLIKGMLDELSEKACCLLNGGSTLVGGSIQG